MIAFPCIYFSILALFFFIRYRKIDLACFISLLYAITGYFSIILDRSGVYAGYSMSAWAVLVYCGLISLMILPMAMNSNATISYIKPIANVKLFKIVAWIAFGYFFVWALLSFDSIMNILTSDMAQARNAVYQGISEDSWMGRLPGPVRLVVAGLNMCLGASWVLQFLAFYSLAVLKLPIKYFVVLLLVSTQGPLGGMMGADRSATAYWIIGLIACMLFFYSFLSKKEKRWVSIFSVVLIGAFAIYLSAMTVSRFEDSRSIGGVEGSLISYFGQNYINFCHFFDTFTTPETTLEMIFPLTYNLLGEGFGSAVATQEYFTLLTGTKTGIFYTFLGLIMFSAGKVPMAIYAIVVFCVSFMMLQRPKKRVSNLKDCYLQILFASILFLGLFGHYYAAATKTFSVIFFYFLITYLCRGRVIK